MSDGAGSTLYNFDVELADNDRNIYESLSLRMAQHPSEWDEYLIARMLAHPLEFADGIEFSRGVSIASYTFRSDWRRSQARSCA